MSSFQARVHPWMMACFGEAISADKLERGDRALEEMLELLQSGDYPAERVTALRDYVWGRPAGEPLQEAGGVMVTLAAYCLAHGLDMHEAGEVELTRISAPEVIAKIRAKQAAKPTGSALPIATPSHTENPVGVGGGLKPIWRRVGMRVIERIDRLIGAREAVPRLNRDKHALLMALHDELDRAAAFIRTMSPADYEEAFALTEAELAAVKRFEPNTPPSTLNEGTE